MAEVRERYVELRRSDNGYDMVGYCSEGSFRMCSTSLFEYLGVGACEDAVRLIIRPNPGGRFAIKSYGSGHRVVYDTKRPARDYIAGSILNFNALIRSAEKHWPGEHRFDVEVVRE